MQEEKPPNELENTREISLGSNLTHQACCLCCQHINVGSRWQVRHQLSTMFAEVNSIDGVVQHPWKHSGEQRLLKIERGSQSVQMKPSFPSRSWSGPRGGPGSGRTGSVEKSRVPFGAEFSHPMLGEAFRNRESFLSPALQAQTLLCEQDLGYKDMVAPWLQCKEPPMERLSAIDVWDEVGQIWWLQPTDVTRLGAPRWFGGDPGISRSMAFNPKTIECPKLEGTRKDHLLGPLAATFPNHCRDSPPSPLPRSPPC